MEVSYFARHIYETETVTSGLCYIKDLMFLENNIVWFWNSLEVQSANSLAELYNMLSYSRFFLTTFCTSFWKRAHSSKEVVNIQGLFVLTVGYVDMTTYPPTILLKEYVLFIGCLYYLSVHCHSCCLYIQHHGGIREITSTPVQIFCFIMFYIINTMKKH